MIFEWDENKNLINQQKHGISFDDVKSVFADISAILFDDPDHSISEDRFLIIGISAILSSLLNIFYLILISVIYLNVEYMDLKKS